MAGFIRGLALLIEKLRGNTRLSSKSLHSRTARGKLVVKSFADGKNKEKRGGEKCGKEPNLPGT